jgi:hypothetical protein
MNYRRVRRIGKTDKREVMMRTVPVSNKEEKLGRWEEDRL